MHGYCGTVLRVDLTSGKVVSEPLPEDLIEFFIGGVGLGAGYLYREIDPGVAALSKENKVFLFTGPLSGTKVPGSGSTCCVTKSPYTGLAGATQANGYLGAYLKSQGFDGIVFEGASENPVYLQIIDGSAELINASHLWRLTTGATEEQLKKDLGLPGLKSSVYAIGPAGENQVAFATLIGDGGHVFGHNGIGAILGYKKFKAIAVQKGTHKFPIFDSDKLTAVAASLRLKAKNFGQGSLKKYGTAGWISMAAQKGILPVRNLTTNIFPAAEKLDGRNLRSKFPNQPKTCFNCPVAHNRIIEIDEGPFTGLKAKEPEYELLATLGSNLGIEDPGSVIYLGDLANQLGLNGTEAGWAISWLMNCVEENILTSKDLEGIQVGWKSVDGAARLLEAIGQQQGIGRLLAGGVRQAAEQLGGQAQKIAIYTHKGSSPRGHDHRARWSELFDTCTGNTGTIESTFGYEYPEELAPPLKDSFDHLEIARTNARINGWRQFEDTLGVCRFCLANDPVDNMAALNSVTGLPDDIAFGMKMGRRIVNLLRYFNCRHGLDPTAEKPSDRYGSTPADGPARGRDIMSRWDEMIETYYRAMGWHQQTGCPLPETLQEFGLDDFCGITTD